MAGKALQTVYTFRIETDRLRVYLASNEKGALRVHLSLAPEPAPDPVEFFRQEFQGERLTEAFSPNRDLIAAVVSALSGEYPLDIPPLAVSFTPFQGSVMRQLLNIPFGETRTYGEVAAAVGRPGGARAVGQALGRNPLPLVFP